MEYLSRIAEEGGVFVVTVAFVDSNGNAIGPSSAVWKLTDVEGNVINGRSAVAVAVAGVQGTIVLEGADLAITEADRPAFVERRIGLTYTYTFGVSRTYRTEIGFRLRNLAGVG